MSKTFVQRQGRVFIVVIICAAILAFIMFSGKHGAQTGPETPLTQSLRKARAICIACRHYALDHGNAFPANLDALFPTYLQDRAALVSPLNPDEPVGYTYHEGLKAPVATDTVLIEDKFAPLQHKRIVSYADGSARVLDTP